MEKENLKNLCKDPERVRKYWEETGAHTLKPEELKALKQKMVYEHTWAITVDAFIEMGNLRNGMDILDAGCGWGRTIIGLKKHIPASKITGIDITPQLIELARKMLLEETRSNDSIFKVGDVQDLGFSDNSFDAVLSTRVLQYVSDPQKAVNEFARVAKKGGRVVVIVPNKLNPLIFIKYHTKLYSPFDLKRWFENAGLKNVKCLSLGYIPTIYRFKNYNGLVSMDKFIRTIPILKYIGGLAVCVGEK